MATQANSRKHIRTVRRKRQRRQRSIIFCTLLMVVICLAVFFWLNNTYILLGKNLIARDTVILDLRNMKITNTAPLEKLRSLRNVDLRGNRISTEQYQSFQQANPDCHIVWDVPLLGTYLENTATHLDFTSLSYSSGDTAQIAQTLKLFPGLIEVDMRNCPLTIIEMQQILTENRNVRVLWDFDVLGERHSSTENTIDLSGYTVSDEAALLDALSCFEHLDSANLMGLGLGMDSMLSLRNNMPDTAFAWNFTLFGVEVTAEDTLLNLAGRSIGQDGLQTLRDGLCLLPKLEYLDICDCGLTNEAMAALRDEYPNIKIVWRVYFADWSTRTDATAFSTDINSSAPRYTSQDFDALKYCTDLMSLDLGHQAVDDLSFIQDMTELRILILVDNDISDISVLANFRKLEYTELFLNDIVDISPLAGLENLIDVNLFGCFVEDATPLYGLKNLERLWIARNNLDRDARKALEKALPHCTVNFTTNSATSEGWRRHSRYTDLLEIIQTNVWHDWT